MNPLMTQNSNMIYYPISAARPIDPSNQLPYTFQHSQSQRIIYPYMINPNISQPQMQNVYNANAQMTNNMNIKSNITADNSSTKPESNNGQNNISNATPFKLLTKYKDIYVPTIYLMDYNDTSKAPFNLFASNQTQNQTQTYNQITGQMMNNNQNNSIFNKYFNYGYNFEQWKAYVNDIKSKFDELNDLVKNGNIRLPEPDNELEYLMAFPSDYGGLGNVQNDQNYENVKFYDPKDTTKNQANKNFMSLIKFEHDQIWFPLEPNPSSLNKPINDYKNIINSPYMKYYYQNYPNLLFRNNPNNSNNISSTILPNTEQKTNNGNNSSNKKENDQNKKER